MASFHSGAVSFFTLVYSKSNILDTSLIVWKQQFCVLNFKIRGLCVVGTSSLRGGGATSLVAVKIADTILAVNDHLKLLLPRQYFSELLWC